VPAGRKVAVVGASGSGKSTLARLLFRFYDVRRAHHRRRPGHARRHAGERARGDRHRSPGHVLFNDTIYYNIAYGRPGATREEVEDAARVAHIADFIARFRPVGDDGRGARAQALRRREAARVDRAHAAEDPPILVLDEATSALDSKTEKSIQAELSEISRNRTTLVIAHRLSTIVDADEILVMDHGRIVERGSFRDLLAANGRFAEMWRLAARGKEIASSRGRHVIAPSCATEPSNS
jgi:ATP-binding cassette subfamily B protein